MISREARTISIRRLRKVFEEFPCGLNPQLPDRDVVDLSQIDFVYKSPDSAGLRSRKEFLHPDRTSFILGEL
jgi:hypothetical protein